AAPTPVPDRAGAVAENERVQLSEFSGFSEPRSGGRRRGAATRPPGGDTVPALDAWVFARLRSGLPLNGEVDLVSDRYRLFACRLAETPVEERERVWAGFLDLMPEADAGALAQSVAAAEPGSPPPTGAPWETLRLGELPPVPDFPADVLP